jgi:acetyl esterase/lipase
VTDVSSAADHRADAVRVQRAIPYGHGKVLDIYRPGEPAAGPVPAVLLWHGVGPDQRDVLEPLARATAELGAMVFVPDWRSDAPDGGRAHLLGSASFTRQHVPQLGGHADAIVLAGWSRGGKAAAGIAVNPAAAGGWRPAAVACLGSGFTTAAPTTGTSPADDLGQARVTPVPFWLVHGTSDPVVSPAQSQRFAALLAQHGWPVQLEELPTDHAGVVMTEYDPELARCRPARDSQAIGAGRRVAQLLHGAAVSAWPSGRRGGLPAGRPGDPG